MPAGMIIFDAAYIAELTSGMNIACALMGEAVNFLKKASLHEGWKCKECAAISDNLDDLNLRLDRLDKGVNETTRILGGSISRFAELESKYRAQVEGISDDLRNNYGFTASGYSGSSGASGTGFAGEAAGSAMGGAMSGRTGGSSTQDNQSSGQPEPSGRGIRVPGMHMPGMSAAENIPGMNPGGMQLPVTHIPDRQDDTVKGVKSALEVGDTAVQGVTESLMTILGADTDIASMPPEQKHAVVRSIVQIYTEGKNVASSSEAIISEPLKPHAQENIAAASGLVSLIGVMSRTMLSMGLQGNAGLEGAGRNAETSVYAPLGGSMTPSNETASIPREQNGGTSGNMRFNYSSLANNAEAVIDNIGDEAGSEEFKEVLKVFTSKGSSGGSSGASGNSFLDRLKSTIMSQLNGDVSLGFFGSIGIKDFLGKVS